MSKRDRSPFSHFFSNYNLIRYLLLFTFGWAIIQIIAYFQTVIVIFVFASILAFLLNYPVQWLEKYIRHNLAVVIIFFSSLIFFLVLFGALGLTVVSELQAFLRQAPNLVDSLLSFLEKIESWLEELNLAINLNFLQEEFQRRLGNALSFSTGIFGNLLTRFVELIIILVIAFFMLLDGQRIWQSLNLNPVLVFFSLLIGVRVAGFLGLFLAIPIAAVVVSFINIEKSS